MDDASRDHDLIETQAEQDGCARPRSRRSRLSRRAMTTPRSLRDCAATRRGARALARGRRGLRGGAGASPRTMSPLSRARPTRLPSSATMRACRDRRVIVARSPSYATLRCAGPRAGEMATRGRRAVVRQPEGWPVPSARSRGPTSTTAAWKPTPARRQGARRVRPRAPSPPSTSRPTIRAATGISSKRRKGCRVRRAPGGAPVSRSRRGPDRICPVRSRRRSISVGGHRRAGLHVALAARGAAAALDRFVLHRPGLRAVPHLGRHTAGRREDRRVPSRSDRRARRCPSTCASTRRWRDTRPQRSPPWSTSKESMLHAILAATALSLTGPQVGAPAPDFPLTTLDGQPVSLSGFTARRW